MALPRFTKQITIAAFFLAVVGGVSLWVYQVIRPKPTCFDGIQNQNEAGVDCGGICALACMKTPQYPSVTVGRTQLFPLGNNAYDVLAEAENKNPDFGTDVFRYEFQLLDASGAVLAARDGASYLLPLEKKSLIEQRLETSGAVVSVVLKTSEENWLEISDFVNANLFIRDKAFSPSLDGGAIGSKATGVVVNQTGYDFGEVEVVIILKGDQGREVAVGRTDMNTLRAGEQRGFEVRWPNAIQNVEQVEMEAYTNLLSNENFLVKYAPTHKRFQEEVPSPPSTRN